MLKLDKATSDTFLEARMEYSSYKEAIRLANTYKVDAEEVQKLKELKQELKDKYKSYEERLLSRMIWNDNMIQLEEGWYGIRYSYVRNNIITSGIMFNLLLPEEARKLCRDTSKQRDYEREQLDQIIPSYMDNDALDKYKAEVVGRAKEVLRMNTSFEFPWETVESNTIGTIVSQHAGVRWVQRKLFPVFNDLEAEEYRKNHSKEIEEAVLSSFNTSQCLWEGSDGISYWFDSDNIMYIVGNNRIITLYEEEFRFNKDINRQIVLLQVDVIKNARVELDKAELQFQDSIREIDEEVDIVNSQLTVLEAEVNLLTSKKKRLLAEREEEAKAVRLQRDKFGVEYSKLFRKWEDR